MIRALRSTSLNYRLRRVDRLIESSRRREAQRTMRAIERDCRGFMAPLPPPWTEPPRWMQFAIVVGPSAALAATMMLSWSFR